MIPNLKKVIISLNGSKYIIHKQQALVLSEMDVDGVLKHVVTIDGTPYVVDPVSDAVDEMDKTSGSMSVSDLALKLSRRVSELESGLPTVSTRSLGTS